jgi:hypothetical protein
MNFIFSLLQIVVEIEAPAAFITPTLFPQREFGEGTKAPIEVLEAPGIMRQS